MKLVATAASMALAVGVVGFAQANTIYDTFGGPTCCSISAGAPANSITAGSPLGDQFKASGSGGYTFTLGLNIASVDRTGTTEVLLYSDAGNTPGVLVSDLGTLLDSDFPLTGNYLQTAYYGGPLTAGVNYWLELYSLTTNLNWLQSTSPLSSDIGATGEYNLYGGSAVINTDGGTADAPFLLNVAVPEPATLAVFGSALAGLSALRRRRRQ